MSEHTDKQLDSIAALKAELDILRPHAGEALKGLGAARLLELIYTSNAIEGNTLTRAETELIVEKGLAVGGKPFRDYQEAIDLHRAHLEMLDLARSDRPIDEAVVLDMHRMIVAETRTDGGTFSPHMRMAQGMARIYPRPEKIPRLMTEFGQWLTTQEPGPEAAIEAHARLVEIHPFNDGNGRTGRLLMNAILVRGDYPPVVIQPDLKGQYIEALNERHVSPDKGPDIYRGFMFERVIEALEFEAMMLRGDLEVQRRLAEALSLDDKPLPSQEPPKGGGTLSAMYNPQPSASVARHGVSEAHHSASVARHDLETISRTDPSQPIERFDEMKPQHAQQESHHPGAYVAIAGEVVRTHDFEKLTTVTVKSELPDGFTRYNSVMLFDPAARRATAALREGDLVRLDARVMENVFEKNGRETYRTDVIANRIDRAEPGTLHEASLIISGELRRGMQSADKVTIGSLVSEGRDGEPRYHTLKAFDPQTRQVLERAQIGDQLTVAGTIGQNSYEKDGQKVYTTDMVADRVLEHVPASRPAPAPLPSSGNDQRPEHRPSNRPR